MIRSIHGSFDRTALELILDDGFREFDISAFLQWLEFVGTENIHKQRSREIPDVVGRAVFTSGRGFGGTRHQGGV